MKKLFSIFSATLLAVVALLPIRPALAASASLSLSPSSGNVAQGAVLTVDIRENSGSEPVNAAKATISYPTDKFDFVGINNSSAFGITVSNNHSGGTVTVARGANPSVSGSQSIASVSLRAKVSSGTAGVNFSGAQEVWSANNNQNIAGGTSGANYSFISSTTPAPAPGPTPRPAARTTPPVTVAPATKDTTPPTITNVQVSSISLRSAVITWETSEPATSEVNYGTDENYGFSAASAERTTSHKLTLDSPLIKVGTLYHFKVKSVDAAGNAATSDDQTFNTLGTKLEVNVINQNNQPVKGVKVAIDQQEGTTDENGFVVLDNLAPGDKVATITFKGNETKEDIAIGDPDPSGTPQSATFQIVTPATNALLFIVPTVLLIGAVLFFAIRRLRSRGGPDEPITGAPQQYYEEPAVTSSGPLFPSNTAEPAPTPGPFPQPPPAPAFPQPPAPPPPPAAPNQYPPA